MDLKIIMPSFAIGAETPRHANSWIIHFSDHMILGRIESCPLPEPTPGLHISLCGETVSGLSPSDRKRITNSMTDLYLSQKPELDVLECRVSVSVLSLFTPPEFLALRIPHSPWRAVLKLNGNRMVAIVDESNPDSFKTVCLIDPINDMRSIRHSARQCMDFWKAYRDFEASVNALLAA
ncbi:MAG: hypothetical protein SFY92_11000 [Verrucomicrobiae bacterium]|nr:hypothetical protein [Verrucomicrobiae bacterium]